jgi:hypothetical protein
MECLVGDPRDGPDRSPAVPGGPGGLDGAVEVLMSGDDQFGSLDGGTKQVVVVSFGDSLVPGRPIRLRLGS